METEQRVNPKSVFLALAFTSGDNPSRIERILIDYLKGRGFEVHTGREISAGVKTDEGLREIMRRCYFGIVIYNELRHNISYEWGLLDGLEKFVVPLGNKNAHIDLTEALSDKNGTTILSYHGDADKEMIISELTKNISFQSAMEKIEDEIARIISIKPEEAREAAKVAVESPVSLSTVGKVEGISDAARREAAVMAEVLKKIKDLTTEGHFYRGNACYYAEDFKEAEAEYREALRLNPNYAEAHNSLGILLGKDLERYEEAEAEFRETLRVNPNDAEAHNNLGNLLGNLGRHEEAEAKYREALRINPDLAEAHNNLGVLLGNLEKHEEAEAEYREALRINPNYAEAHSNLGNLLGDLERCEEAETEFREALRVNPDLAETHNNLGILLSNLERCEEAEAEYGEALRVNPNYAEAHNNLGILLGKDLERYEEAKAEFREALRVNPNYAEAHYNLGVLLDGLERYHKEIR